EPPLPIRIEGLVGPVERLGLDPRVRHHSLFAGHADRVPRAETGQEGATPDRARRDQVRSRMAGRPCTPGAARPATGPGRPQRPRSGPRSRPVSSPALPPPTRADRPPAGPPIRRAPAPPAG